MTGGHLISYCSKKTYDKYHKNEMQVLTSGGGGNVKIININFTKRKNILRHSVRNQMAEIKGKITNPALVNARVLYNRRTKLGIPTEVFLILMFLNVFAVVLCVMYFSTFSVISLILFVLVSVVPMKFVFHGDPDAHKAWIYGYLSPSRLNNTHAVKRRITFIDAI